MVKNRVTGYGVGAARINLYQPPISANRAPTSSDTDYDIGQVWIYNGSAYILTSSSAGVANWQEAAGPGGFPITPYVVGSSSLSAGFTTIQSAINAAHSAGGGLVFVQPGTYTENLTFYDNIFLFGSSESATFITGVHVPPSSGNLNIFRCTFISSTHVFSSSAAGSTTIIIEDCTIQVTNGYTFNLPNWTGALALYDMGENSTNNGVVNNTGGAVCFFVSVTIGAGTGNTMITSGPVELQEADVNCPWNAQTGSNLACDFNNFNQPVTFSNNSTGILANCRWSTGASAAITMSSSSAISILDSIITSSNNPAIAGSGAGTLTLGTTTFTSNSSVAGTLTVSYAPSRLGSTTLTGNLSLPTAGNKLSIATGTNASIGTSSAMVAGTTTVNTTAVTASSKIFLTVNTPGGTQGTLSAPTASIVAGTSFVINSSSNTDTSTVNWWIIN